MNATKTAGKRPTPGLGLAFAGGAALIALVSVGCARPAGSSEAGENGQEKATATGQSDSIAGGLPGAPSADGTYDPLATALANKGKTRNYEAGVPPMCYTKTAGKSNPCWVCHAGTRRNNPLGDFELQLEYAFSDTALTNHWANLFKDRTAEVAAISDDDILAYVRQDNYRPLQAALKRRGDDYQGYLPDLDYDRGFDEDGFANDGSDWRAIRYHVFPGAFWPTNGGVGDVQIRLAPKFRTAADGTPSREHYKANLSILEAAIASDPRSTDAEVTREIEPIDETIIGLDLDGNGTLEAGVTSLRGLPENYVGGAADHEVRRGIYPAQTEFYHSVRYLDPDEPTLMSRRFKELRYMKKVRELDRWGIQWAYEHEINAKEDSKLPVYRGSSMVGLLNEFGWQLQGFIEDEAGHLRLATDEETRFCMGCHSALGVTTDQAFSFARKLPGAAGWGHQDLRGMQDRPQVEHTEPEILTYFKRVRAGDEFRRNDELLERFFDENGDVKEKEVRRAALGGDKDLAWLLAPTRERALALNKAYRVIVAEQSFTLGRDPVIKPPENVHAKVENGSTENGETGLYFLDGNLQLDWAWSPKATAQRPTR